MKWSMDWMGKEMSLREEIEEYFVVRGCIWTKSPVYFEEIMQMIEKRIDSIQDQLKKDYDDDLVVYGIDESFSRVKRMLK